MVPVIDEVERVRRRPESTVAGKIKPWLADTDTLRTHAIPAATFR